MIRDRPNFRRHEGACPFYRENWLLSEERISGSGEVALYEIYCLREMPPETAEEQHSCMLADTVCWRDGLAHRSAMLRQRRESKQAPAGVS